jgi:two-component system, LytTR family, response regulator
VTIGSSDILRVAIVDDEPLAREGLRVRLAAVGGVEVIAEYGDAEDAVQGLPVVRPDVLFLDVEMPERDGFGVLAALERGPLPVVVFVTAHAEHAVAAFRVGAADYLLKPYDDESLGESVRRARRLVDQARASGRTFYSPHLLVKSDGRRLLVDLEHVDWIDADRDRVRIHRGDECIETRSTLTAMHARLDPARFARIHRTTIVALAAVQAIEPYSRGEYVVVLSSGRRLPLSRRYRDHLLEALQRASPGAAGKA